MHNVPNPTVVCVFGFCQALLNVHTVWSFNPVFTAWIFHTCSVNNPVMHRVALGWEIQRAAGVRCTRRSQLFREVVPTRAVNCEMRQTFAVTVCRHGPVNYWSIHIDVLYPLSTHFLLWLLVRQAQVKCIMGYLALRCPHEACLMHTC